MDGGFGRAKFWTAGAPMLATRGPLCPSYFGGSLTGGGASLQAGVRQFSQADRSPYVAYWTSPWSEVDLARVQVEKGDPAGQARLEAYTL